VLKAFQAVIRASIDKVSNILSYSDKEQQAFFDAVGNVWFQYLQAWKDDADKYGTIS
jgi:hypothetical protein